MLNRVRYFKIQQALKYARHLPVFGASTKKCERVNMNEKKK